MVAIAYTFGVWLMAPMSLGAFRWILPIERRAHWKSERTLSAAVSAYRLTVYCSLALVLPLVMIAAWWINGHWYGSVLAVVVVTYDYLSHEQSRRLLYSGQLHNWAWFLLGRNLLLPILWLAGFLVAPLANTTVPINPLAMLSIVSLPALALAATAMHIKLLQRQNSKAMWRFMPLAWRRMRKYWQYSACGVMAKAHLNVDKFLVALVAPELTWVIAIFGYIFQVPVMAYEMLHIAPLKAKILDLTAPEIRHRQRFQKQEILLFVSTALIAASSGFGFLLLQKLDHLALPLTGVYLMTALVASLNLKWSELVFWTRGDRWAPFRIDLAAALVMLAASAIVPLYFASLIWVRVPALLGLGVKTWLSRRYLKGKHG